MTKYLKINGKNETTVFVQFPLEFAHFEKHHHQEEDIYIFYTRGFRVEMYFGEWAALKTKLEQEYC